MGDHYLVHFVAGSVFHIFASFNAISTEPITRWVNESICSTCQSHRYIKVTQLEVQLPSYYLWVRCGFQHSLVRCAAARLCTTVLILNIPVTDHRLVTKSTTQLKYTFIVLIQRYTVHFARHLTTEIDRVIAVLWQAHGMELHWKSLWGGVGVH